MDCAPAGLLPRYGPSYVFDPDAFEVDLSPQLVAELRPLRRLQRAFVEASAALSLADARAGALHAVRALSAIVAGTSRALDDAGPRFRTRGGRDISDSTGSSGANTPAQVPRPPLFGAALPSAGPLAAEPLAALQLTLRAFQTALRAYQDALHSPPLRDAEAVCRGAVESLRADCLQAAAETAQVVPIRSRPPLGTCIYEEAIVWKGASQSLQSSMDLRVT